MDNLHKQTYLELVETLTNCPVEEIDKIFNLRSNLIDVDLIRAMNDELDKLEHQRNTHISQSALESWARLQLCLALSYSYFGREQGENFEKAIISCEKALQVYTVETFPREWAKTHQTLGDALSSKTFFTHNQKKSSLLEDSLQLLNAHKFRLSQEREDNNRRIITCYENTLKVYTYETTPQEWARMQSLLGVAYHTRHYDQPLENQERAIICFENALKVFNPIPLPIYEGSTPVETG
ncbi:hypothetical protein IQ277_29320 [Nostocales cyanobacterium LEGE 12452]|nr:hypothetical protein [Nostocales cyanobacterium LEGE 12452]